MSYLKDDGNPITDPFALVGKSSSTGTFRLSNSRWDYSSQDWVDENVGTNGLAFHGKGYIWAMCSPSSNAILNYEINDGTSDRHQSSSCFYGANVNARCSSDDTAISYSNTTEISVTQSYYDVTYFSNGTSRCGIIRMER